MFQYNRKCTKFDINIENDIDLIILNVLRYQLAFLVLLFFVVTLGVAVAMLFSLPSKLLFAVGFDYFQLFGN